MRHDTIADGLRTCLGTLTFPIVRELVDEILLINEEEIGAATLAMMFQAKVVAETVRCGSAGRCDAKQRTILRAANRDCCLWRQT